MVKELIQKVDFIGGIKLPINTVVEFPFDNGSREITKVGKTTGKSPRSTAELIVTTDDGNEYYVHKCFIKLQQDVK